MKKFLLASATFAVFAAATPASAQVGGIFRQGIQGLLGGNGINNRLASLESQLNIAFQRGEISQREASRLQSELSQLRQLDQSFRFDGLDRAERSELQQRLQVLERRIQQARFDRDDRFGDNDRFDDDDRRFGRNACPPGLAKKNNGCLPPGQAKKGDRSSGQFDDMRTDRRFQNTDRFFYRQDGNRILQIDRRTGQVVRVIDRRR